MPQKKVLVVDDDQLVCWALKKEFTGLGFSTQVVKNGADALLELPRQPYDIVFLDIHLPDANGMTLLGEIEKISPNTTVIIMSGDASETNRERAFAGGALQFIEKPFDLSEIHGILKSTLGKYPQKRKHPRHICRIPLRISIVEPAPEEAQYDLHNLSGTMTVIGFGGLTLRTQYPLRVGQHIRARADAINGQFRRFVPDDSSAEVVWVAAAQNGVVAGLKFVS
jgi:DNA-binding response OmpR family regulator